MLPGEYVLHEYIGVFDVVSFSIYGSRSEENGSARENHVIINCEYRQGGFGFTNVTNFSLSGITVANCGVDRVKRGFRHGYLSLSYYALHIALGLNVKLSFFFITNSTQFGLLCWVPQVYMTQCSPTVTTDCWRDTCGEK